MPRAKYEGDGDSSRNWSPIDCCICFLNRVVFAEESQLLNLRKYQKIFTRHRDGKETWYKS